MLDLTIPAAMRVNAVLFIDSASAAILDKPPPSTTPHARSPSSN